MHLFLLKCQSYDKESVCRLHCCIVPRRVGQVIFKKVQWMKSSQLMYFTMFPSLLASTPSDLSSQLHRERGPSCFELKFLAHSFLASMKGFDYNRVNSKVLANSVPNPARLEWRFQTRTTSKMPTPRPWPPKLGERGGGGVGAAGQSDAVCSRSPV